MLLKTINGLNVNFDSKDPKDYIRVLDIISHSTKNCVSNLGAFADITSIECTSGMVANIQNEYLTVEIQKKEIPGSRLEKGSHASEPYEMPLDVLVGRIEGKTARAEDSDTNGSYESPIYDDSWKKVSIGGNKIILDKTIENHDCEIEEECRVCSGTGKCHKCNGIGHNQCGACYGSGKIRCNNCGGSGTCRRCRGRGQIKCQKCGGSGYIEIYANYEKGWKRERCGYCQGTGVQKCPDCTSFFSLAGSGRCSKCDGSGELTCKNCGGSGKITCSTCGGSGSCKKCHGRGRVTCSRCLGTGVYQTFLQGNVTHYKQRTSYYNYDDVDVRMTLDAVKEQVVFDGVWRKMYKRDVLEYEKVDELEKSINRAFIHNSDAFKLLSRALIQRIKDLNEPGVLYQCVITIYKIPMVRVNYKINDIDYWVGITGEQGVVYAETLPSKIVVFKEGIITKIHKRFTKKKRQIAYIKLAAYIFHRDGCDVSESRIIETFLKTLKYNNAKKEAFISSLSAYDGSIPYATFKKEIKCLFSSRKTLTFAWQCMTIDKKYSEQEKYLFEDLCKDVGVSDSTEIEKIKSYAKKYCNLKDSIMVEEYLK